MLKSHSGRCGGCQLIGVHGLLQDKGQPRKLPPSRGLRSENEGDNGRHKSKPNQAGTGITQLPC